MLCAKRFPRRVSFPTLIVALLLASAQAHGDELAPGGDEQGAPAAFLDPLNQQLAHTEMFIDKGFWTLGPVEILPSGADPFPTMDFGASTLTSVGAARQNIIDKHGDVVRQVFDAWYLDDGTVLGPADAGFPFFVLGNTEPNGLTTFVLYQPTAVTTNADGTVTVTLTLAESGLARVDLFPSGTDYTVVGGNAGDPTAVEYAVMLALIIVVCITSADDLTSGKHFEPTTTVTVVPPTPVIGVAGTPAGTTGTPGN
jgi:hypothetical protein